MPFSPWTSAALCWFYSYVFRCVASLLAAYILPLNTISILRLSFLADILGATPIPTLLATRTEPPTPWSSQHPAAPARARPGGRCAASPGPREVHCSLLSTQCSFTYVVHYNEYIGVALRWRVVIIANGWGQMGGVDGRGALVRVRRGRDARCGAVRWRDLGGRGGRVQRNRGQKHTQRNNTHTPTPNELPNPAGVPKADSARRLHPSTL
ncbi:hypothetical protein HYPSUDRAFT_1043057 [Hypholoma sublateritium FD-334 SS-4]|uniref:Uncharacterized protein n=1 Tax=Hypholoma sublateritium (strain FD-334 SS-4) TaxID=945553 RepID=A0A0D2NDP9_HYPSF|nr:hypothetical protein HYPSUDRAFT_1043057 [Hypholoma sublateritium FD-334 SS-4]